MRGQGRININHQFRIATTGPLEINDSVDLLNFRREVIRNAIEFIGIAAEDLDFHRFRRTLKVAQHVLEKLYEFRINASDTALDLSSQVFDDLFSGPVSLRARLQLNENVAFVLLGREQSEFGARASRKGRLFRHLR